MSQALIRLLGRCAPRERILLALLVLVVAPVALWLGVLAPLGEARRAAETRVAEATALQAWVQARVGEYTALAPSRPTGSEAADTGPVGASAVEQTLIDARLHAWLKSFDTDDDGGIRLRFEDVVFEELMTWISAQDPDWGYEITTLAIQETSAPGLSIISLQLNPR